MESENKAGKRKNKRKSRKALIIGIIICAVLVAAGGLLYGGEWSHTYEQVFLPDQGVFSPLEDEEHVYDFGPEEYTEEIGSEEADTGTENSTEETDEGTEISSEETDEDVEGQLTDEQAVESIKQFCYAKNPDLESIVDEGQYEVYWTVISSSEDEIVVMFRSYTAAQLYYYIDRNTGDTYETEFVPGITTEEERTGEEFNINEYASDIAF